MAQLLNRPRYVLGSVAVHCSYCCCVHMDVMPYMHAVLYQVPVSVSDPGPQLLQGPLLSAALSPDATLLLLVAAAGAVLLQRTSPIDAAAAFDHVLYCSNPLVEKQKGAGGLPAGAVEGSLPGSFTFAAGVFQNTPHTHTHTWLCVV